MRYTNRMLLIPEEIFQQMSLTSPAPYAQHRQQKRMLATNETKQAIPTFDDGEVAEIADLKQKIERQQQRRSKLNGAENEGGIYGVANKTDDARHIRYTQGYRRMRKLLVDRHERPVRVDFGGPPSAMFPFPNKGNIAARRSTVLARAGATAAAAQRQRRETTASSSPLVGQFPRQRRVRQRQIQQRRRQIISSSEPFFSAATSGGDDADTENSGDGDVDEGGAISHEQQSAEESAADATLLSLNASVGSPPGVHREEQQQQ